MRTADVILGMNQTQPGGNGAIGDIRVTATGDSHIRPRLCLEHETSRLRTAVIHTCFSSSSTMPACAAHCASQHVPYTRVHDLGRYNMVL